MPKFDYDAFERSLCRGGIRGPRWLDPDIELSKKDLRAEERRLAEEIRSDRMQHQFSENVFKAVLDGSTTR